MSRSHGVAKAKAAVDLVRAAVTCLGVATPSAEEFRKGKFGHADAIPSLLEKWPHVINFRDAETGDTVLHHCARAGKPEATQKWLSGSVPFTPLENIDGRSALREAIDKQQLDTARELVRLLDSQLTLVRTPHITNDQSCGDR